MSSNTIFWDEVKPSMKLEAKEGSWFADGKLVYWTGETAAEARAFLGRLFQEQKPDRELKALHGFSGTHEYHRVLGFNVTDGVRYIMENGYSYFVTDVLAVIPFKPRLRTEPFLAITYTVDTEKHTGEFVITDGNEGKLYSQKYEYTDGKIKAPLKLFLTDRVLMLAGEY